MNRPGDIRIDWVSETTEDMAQAIEGLIRQLSPDATPPTLEQIDDIVDSKCSSLFIARDADDRIVGMIILVTYRISTGMRVWIEDLVVDKKARGRGIGEALCRRAIEEARELGAKTIDLTSRPSRQEANQLYQKLGFKRRDTNLYRLTL